MDQLEPTHIPLQEESDNQPQENEEIQNDLL